MNEEVDKTEVSAEQGGSVRKRVVEKEDSKDTAAHSKANEKEKDEALDKKNDDSDDEKGKNGTNSTSGVWNARWHKGLIFTLACVVCSSSLIVYLIYNYSSIVARHRKNPLMMSWKDFEMIDLPAEMIAKSKNVKIHTRTVDFKLDGQDVKTFVREPEQQGDKTAVLLLHGNAFSSENWQKIGTIQLVATFGHRVFAVDVPGYGNSPAIGKYDKGSYVEKLIEALGITRPILVAPSMAGSFAMPFILKSPENVHLKLSGFVPIAIVGTEYKKHFFYQKVLVPTMIIRGENDHDLGEQCQGNLQMMPQHETFVIKSAGHAAYIDVPDDWHRLLFNFMFAIEKRKLST
ncbi:putative protein-lysine deacylase ABHD14B isoform X2 [Tubulanus polymorphus]|uniref:putative protein-lysine deacylase ABHD14B isoform X2 n=1 Tax=Tubulanus polymorphus TaxID=672921 RepID=UPI003DA5C091